jgi:CDP-diacylglycerol--serine O-phosphatidyltransferase
MTANREAIREPRTETRMRLISGRILQQRKKVVAPLRRGVFLLPVTITSLGLLSGFYSIVSSINGHFEVAAVMIAVAFVCDGLDGRVARASRTSSEFGVEYDSLSDVVAFGVAPACLAYTWALKPLNGIGIVIAGMFVVCGALRLARFNIQTETVDKNRFVGLPIPGAAALVSGTALSYSYFELASPRALTIAMAPITLALGLLMISRVPYPSFKTITVHKRAPIELTIGVVMAAAMLFALPQLTAFLLAAAFVLSGPYLMLRGEEMQPKVPVLHPVPPANGKNAPPTANGKQTGSLDDKPHQDRV